MYQAFYVIAVAALIAVLYGAAESKYDIVVYGVAAAVMFYFMGAVLNYLSDILDVLKKPGNEAVPKPDKVVAGKEKPQNEAK